MPRPDPTGRSVTTFQPRRRPVLFRSAVVVAVLLLAGGSVVAVRSWLATSGPAGTVRGYLAALAGGDAPSALAFGDPAPR